MKLARWLVVPMGCFACGSAPSGSSGDAGGDAAAAIDAALATDAGTAADAATADGDAAAASRDPALWPFASDSPWNVPLATAAQYESPTDAKTSTLLATASKSYVNRASYSFPVYVAANADPLATMKYASGYVNGKWGAGSVSIHVPTGAAASSGTDSSIVIVTPDHQTVLALGAAACNPFGQYKCRARQSEAKATLGMIKSSENSYFAEHKKYTASTEDLGVSPSARYYGIELSITGGGTGYKATAKGDKPATMGDEWSVDQSGAVTAVHDKCHE